MLHFNPSFFVFISYCLTQSFCRQDELFVLVFAFMLACTTFVFLCLKSINLYAFNYL